MSTTKLIGRMFFLVLIIIAVVFNIYWLVGAVADIIVQLKANDDATALAWAIVKLLFLRGLVVAGSFLSAIMFWAVTTVGLNKFFAKFGYKTEF